MASRRQFLKVGVVSGAVLAGAGWLALRRDPPRPLAGLQWLDERSAAIVAALIPAILAGTLPEAGSARERARRDALEAFDRAVAGLAPAIQEEIAQLFAILAPAPARLLLAGLSQPWEEAGVAEVTAFLSRWRTSRFPLLRAGYQALTQLVIAAWYGNPASWEAIAYPGPPALEARGT